jgi:hypothetical protein
MTLIVGHGHTRFSETIANRTPQSKGSLGGNKKAGTVYIGTSWFINSGSMYLARAPKNASTSVAFNLYNTTRNPVQQNRATYSIVRGIM